MLKDKNIISLAIIIVGILIAGAVIYPKTSSNQQGEDFLISEDSAKELAMGFINDTMLQGQMTASFSGISKEYGLYKIDIMFEGNPYSSYVSGDGRIFFPEGINIEEIKSLAQEIPSPDDIAGVEDLTPVVINEGLEDFISCLEDKEFIIYGASWCPYCTQLVDLFGGYEMADPIYVECTEEEALCREKGIQGYPTILISDVKYEGPRNFESFSSKTGCLI